MKLGLTFTDIDMFGRRMAIGDTKALLSQLDQSDVLEFCALLNAINEVAVGPGIAWSSPKHLQLLERLLHELLTPVYHAKARRLVLTERPFVPLVSAALRSLMKLACMWCPPEGGKSLDNPRLRQNVSKVLFALQGAMLTKTSIGAAHLDWGYRAFPAVTRCVLCNPRLNLGHDMGRLHAIVSRPTVGDLLSRKEGGRTIGDWFEETFGLAPADYRKVSQALAGYAGRFKVDAPHRDQLWLDLEAFSKCFTVQEERVRQLVQLATTTVEEVAGGIKTEPLNLSEVVFDANDVLLVRPLLQVGSRHLVTSYDSVFGKFVRGLPYLAMAAAERAGLTGKALDGARGPVGYIFEGYAGWLADERFRGGPVRTIKNYKIATGNLPKGHTDPERDVLLILGDVGFPIEVKAKVPPRPLRSSGDLQMLAILVEELSCQAVTAADALVKGECRTADGLPIAPVRKAYPGVLVFERFPARFPFSDAFETELEKRLQKPIFKDSSTVGPLQVFDIDQYEDWDKAYHLPDETSRLFNALQKRAKTPRLRYESLIEIRSQEDGLQPTWDSVVDKLCAESEAVLCGKKA
jgi:hypothetical protein